MNIKVIKEDELYNLRHEILRPNLPYGDIIYDTDVMLGTFHIGAYDGNRLMSIASFNVESSELFDEKNQYRLRAMATHPDYRKLGVGREIVDFAIGILIEKGTEVLWCKGRTSVQGYYEKIGFSVMGDVFDYPTLGPHIILYRDIKGVIKK